nr:putative ribonuclease H-like domain-containing protein [Tanacetum cinerariifolium]
MVSPTARNHAHRGNHKHYALMTHQNPQKHMVFAAVLTQSKLVSITAVRPVSTAVPKTSVTRPKQVQPIVTKPKSPIRRHITRSPSPKTSNSTPRVTAVKASVELNGGYVAFGGNPKGGNMSYLSNFKELNGGYVAFGGNPKGGKIIGKGKIKTDSSLESETQSSMIGNLVRGLPIKFFENNNTCVACKKGKQHRASCKTKPVSSIDQPLYRLHMDLFGPTFIKSVSKKSYCLVVTDDYSRFTWVFFLVTKDETSPILKTFIADLENQLSLKVKVIRSDNRTECKNNDLNQLCGLKGIKREFSVPRTPQQNSIAERKNITLIEAAKTMLADLLLPILFWTEAVNTACYIQNRVLVTKPHNKTPYELLHGRTPSIGFMRPFGCLVTILNTLDYIGKSERKVDEGFLVGYSVSSKAFRVINGRTCIVQETLHVNFLESKPNVAVFGSTNPQNSDGDAAFDGKEPDFNAKKPEFEVIVSPSSTPQARKQDDKQRKRLKARVLVNAAGTLVPTIGQISPNSTNTFSATGNTFSAAGNTFSDVGPSNAVASLTHRKSSFIDASQLLDDPDMPKLEDITYFDNEDDVGTEADFNNLETSITVSPIPTTRVHKDHPVTQIIGDLSSATQTRSITKVAKVARIEAIRLFLAYASFTGFMVYQMDVKSAFLYGTIKEEVYVCQPLGFEDPDHPNKVYKVVKALYGLHQAPSAWYETLANYLLENGFQKGKIDQTLFIKRQKGDILLVQIYVDNIIFGATNKDLCKSFEKLMKDKFQISSMGELTFFLGLQVKQKKDEIFISQDKYVAEILRKFGLTERKSASTPIDIERPLLKDPDGEDVNVHIYRSMIGSLMYLTSSRPDIMFAVCTCTRFQVTPKASHLHAIKRIFRYLKGKPHLGLWYPTDSPFDLVAYSDSDYAGASLYRKSTTEGCQFLGCRLISWQCKKQTVVATSSTEAEYIATASFSKCYGVFEKDVTCTKYTKCWFTYHTTNSSQFTMSNPHQELASLDQMVSGKDSSNPLMADNLPKIKWFSTHHVTLIKSWLVQKQTALGKDKSNPLMADNLPKIKWFSTHHVTLIKSWLVQKQTALGKDKSNPLIVDSLLKTIWSSIHRILINEVLTIPGQMATAVDKKKVVVTEATIREALYLDDAEGVECLPNEEIFEELARMGYKKPSTKLTFYKAFFSSHLVRNVDSPSKFYMYLRFLQLMIKKEVGDLSTHTTKYTSPALTQKVFTNIRRVGKGFSRVKTPLFAGMLVEHHVVEEGDAEVHGKEVNAGDTAEGDISAAHGEAPTVDEEPSISSPTPHPLPPQPSYDIPSNSQRVETSDETVMDDVSNQGRMIVEMDQDDDVVLEDDKEVADEDAKDETKPAEVQEVVDVVTTAKLITEVVTAASETITTATQVLAITLTAASARVAAAPSRRRNGVVIRDPKKESTTSTIIHGETKSKDKGKGILVEEPKPLKKKQQIEKAKKDPTVKRYQTKEQIEEDENKALKRLNETPTERVAKRRKLDEEVEELKRHFQIVPNEDDDVYTEATPLARKVHVVDYQIIEMNKKPYYKIIRADDTHQLYKNQRSVHGPTKVKGWKLLESCGVHIITFTTTRLILLVEKMYPLTRFTLDQMLNVTRLEVEEESEVSLELLRRSHADHTLLNDFELDTEENYDPPLPDLRTIEELCQPSLNGRGGSIAPIAIQETNFGLKNDMIQQLRNKITNFCQRLDKSLFEACECYKISIDRCTNHNMLPVTQIDTFYNRLTLRHRDTINAAAGGTFMKRRLEECYDLIENMTAHHNDWDTSAQRITPSCETCGGPHSYNDCLATVGQSQNVYAVGAYQGGNSYQPQGASRGQNSPLAYQALAYQASGYQVLVHQPPIPQPQVVTTTEFTNYIKANDAILKNMQTNMTSLTNSNLELKNMFGQFMKMNTASSSGLGTLPSNTITNPKEDLKGITTRSGTAYQGPTIPTTSSFFPQVVERETEATKDTMPPTNNRSTKDVQPLVVQIETTIPNFEPVVAPTERALIDVYAGELTLRVNNEAVTFNHDQISRYSANYNDMKTNQIGIIDMAYEEYSQEVLDFFDVIAGGNFTPYYDPIVSTSSLT